MFGETKRKLRRKSRELLEANRELFNKNQELITMQLENSALNKELSTYKDTIAYFEKLNKLNSDEIKELLDKKITLTRVLEMFNKHLKKYEVVTLCGSTKFKDDFIRVQEELTLQGKIVISVGLFGHADNKYGNEITNEVKEMLDDIHKRKIDLSDAIYVINKDGYIGSSTKSEIEYATLMNKKIYYMENGKYVFA